MQIRSTMAAALLVAMTSAAHANLLINGSLETTAKLNSHGRVLVPTEAPTALGPAWTITQGTVDLKPTSYWQATNGRFSVDLIGTPGLGGIAQTVAGLTIGQDYVLTFDFSVNPDPREKGSTKILQVQAVGGSILATQTYQRVVTNESKAHMHYTQQTFQFTADSTSVTLTLSALPPIGLPAPVTSATAVCGPVIDNLDLEAAGSTPPSPEPASLGLLGIGSLLLLKRRKH